MDATGRRFTNEAAPSKVTDRAVLTLVPATHWLVFDADGLKKLTIRGAAWMNAKTVRAEILANEELVKTAQSIEALAEAAGLPRDALLDTVQRFNRFVEQGIPMPDPDKLQDPAAVADAIVFAVRAPAGSVVQELMVTPLHETSWP